LKFQYAKWLELKMNQKMENCETLSEAIDLLRKEGYVEDFNLLKDKISCQSKAIYLFTDDFQIDKYYRFEGNSDPADESIVYAISSEKYALKGVLVDGYGISSENLDNQIIQKLKIWN
jgi:ribosomal protein S8